MGAAPAVANWALSRAFATAVDGAVFYSGEGAGAAASEYAATTTGASTIESTFGGNILQATNGVTRGISGRVNLWLWQVGSRYFAEGASGTATVFLRNPRPDGVWNTIERPILEERGVEIIEHTLGP